MVLGVTFLLMNGYWVDVSQDEFERVGLATAEGSMGVAEPAKWFELNSRPDPADARG
jgi:prophage maintenance system killer protein